MSSRKRKWRRGCLVLLVLMLLAVAGAALAARQIFDGALYRALVVEKLAARTGLPVSLASLEIGLFPTPTVDGEGLVVGEGDFRAEVAAFSAGFDIQALFSGGNATARVRMDGVEVALPEDGTLGRRLSALMQAFRGGGGGGEPLPLDIHRVVLNDVTVTQGGKVRVAGRGQVVNVLNPEPGLRYDLVLPTARGPVTVEGVGTAVLRGGGGPLVRGDARVTAEALRVSAKLGDAAAALEAHFEARGPEDIYAEFEGALTHEALPDGVVEGKVWRRDGEYIANDVTLSGTGLDATGDLTIAPDAPTAVRVAAAKVSGAPLARLLEALAGERVAADKGATLDITGLTFGTGGGAPPRFVSGGAVVEGIDLVPGGAWPVLRSLSGELTVAENVVTVEQFGNRDVTVRGTVTPDFAAGTAAVDLGGEADLALLPAEKLPAAVRGVSGWVGLSRLTGTFAPGGGLPADLALEAVLQGGAFTVAHGSLREPFEVVGGTVSGTRDGLTVDLAGEGAALGAVTVTGEADLAGKAFAGRCEADLARGIGLIQREGTLNPYLKALCTGYGRSAFDVTVSWGAAPSVRLARVGGPRLDVEATLAGGALDGVEGWGDVDLAWFAPVLPPRVQALGTAPAVLRHRAGDAGFTVEMNLNEASIAAGDHLEKKAGDHLQLSVAGRVEAGKWTPQTARVDCLGERVDVAVLPGRIAAGDFRLRLPELVKLLPPGATASGSVSGTVRTGPLEVDLRLEGAGFGLSPELRLDSLDGRVTYHDDLLRVESLRVLGADSDCTLSAGLEGGRWSGRLTGAKLNLNAVEVMVDSARAVYDARGRPGAEAAASRGRITGTVDVDIDALYYRRGRVDGVTARCLLEAERIRLEDLAFRLGEGNVAGKAWYRYRDGEGQATAAAQLEAKGIDLKVVDDFALKEPRGMRGTADANLAVRWPLGTGQPWYHGADGALVYTARDGTYGRLAHGAALLSLLKTTSLFRLKLPQYREQGLSFRETYGSIAINQGVVSLDEFLLDAGSHAMEGEVRADFPGDALAGEMRFYILESVTGLLDRVPGLGGAADVLKERSGLRITVRGTPEQPVFGKPEETRFETRPIVRGSQEALRQGASAVEDSLRAGTRGLRRTIESFGF